MHLMANAKTQHAINTWWIKTTEVLTVILISSCRYSISLYHNFLFLHLCFLSFVFSLPPSSLLISSLCPPFPLVLSLLPSPPSPPPSVRANRSQKPQHSKHSTQPRALSLPMSVPMSLAHTNTQESTCLSPSLSFPLSLSLTVTHRNLHLSPSPSLPLVEGEIETEFTENKTEQTKEQKHQTLWWIHL